MRFLDASIRILAEENEKKILCDKACLAVNSRGRVREEEECNVRTCFQRDRDRIIHCQAFRRLKHKTQVFLAPSGDHYRTRLTHTLEVAQIARTIARALRLNEDLTEAVALGHDLGHSAMQVSVLLIRFLKMVFAIMNKVFVLLKRLKRAEKV